MLAFTRKINDEVTLTYGGKVIGTFKIISVRGDKAVIGFNMPKEVGIYRTEIIKDGIIPKLGGGK